MMLFWNVNIIVGSRWADKEVGNELWFYHQGPGEVFQDVACDAGMFVERCGSQVILSPSRRQSKESKFCFGSSRKFHNCRKNHNPFAVGGSFRHNAGGTGAEIEWQQMTSILWGNKFSIRSYSIHSFIHSFVRSFVHSFIHSFVRSFVPCYCSHNQDPWTCAVSFFVHHSVVFQYLAETHLCPVCEMTSLTFVLPASRLQHSVRLGTAGFSMSGKKSTDIEARYWRRLCCVGWSISINLFQGETLGCAALGGLLTLSPPELGGLLVVRQMTDILSKCSTVSFLFTKKPYNWIWLIWILLHFCNRGNDLLHANCKHAMWTE